MGHLLFGKLRILCPAGAKCQNTGYIRHHDYGLGRCPIAIYLDPWLLRDPATGGQTLCPEDLGDVGQQPPPKAARSTCFGKRRLWKGWGVWPLSVRVQVPKYDDARLHKPLQMGHLVTSYFHMEVSGPNSNTSQFLWSLALHHHIWVVGPCRLAILLLSNSVGVRHPTNPNPAVQAATFLRSYTDL